MAKTPTDFYTRLNRSMFASIREVGAMPFALFQYYRTWATAEFIAPKPERIAVDMGLIDKQGKPSKSAVANLKKVLKEKRWIDEVDGKIVLLKFVDSSEYLNPSQFQRSDILNARTENINENSENLNDSSENLNAIYKEENKQETKKNEEISITNANKQTKGYLQIGKNSPQTADEIGEAIWGQPDVPAASPRANYFQICTDGMKKRLKTPTRLPEHWKWQRVFEFWRDNNGSAEDFLTIFDLKEEIRIRKKENWMLTPSIMEKCFGKLESLKNELENLKNGGNENAAIQRNYQSALERRTNDKCNEITKIEQLRFDVAERDRLRTLR